MINALRPAYISEHAISGISPLCAIIRLRTRGCSILTLSGQSGAFNGIEVDNGGFVATGGDAASVFEAAEHALDLVALPVAAFEPDAVPCGWLCWE